MLHGATSVSSLFRILPAILNCRLEIRKLPHGSAALLLVSSPFSFHFVNIVPAILIEELQFLLKAEDM